MSGALGASLTSDTRDLSPLERLLVIKLGCYHALDQANGHLQNDISKHDRTPEAGPRDDSLDGLCRELFAQCLPDSRRQSP
jgi:hypothetical protein